MKPPKRPNPYFANFYQFLWVIAALWAVEVVDSLFLDSKLENYGIHPGNWGHWEGILLAPLLHADIAHILGNSIGLAIFGAIILIRGWKSLAIATGYAVLCGGLLVMIVASSNSIHIGASSVVYGYWAYIIGLGVYEKAGGSILIALAVIFFYGGFVYGMFPNDHNIINHISWEGHLGGAVGGFAAARETYRI